MSPVKPSIVNRLNLYAVNYEAARRGFTLFDTLLKLAERNNTFVVIDESSFIKNANTENFKSILELCKRARHVRLLNGTPQTQNILDWYPQLRCLGEFNGMEPTIFRARYARMGGYMGRIVQGPNEENLAELQKIVQRCSFRALKADWRADLPPQNDILVHLEMTPQQRIYYNEMMDEFFTSIDGLDVPAPMCLTQMDKLRQISSCIAMHKGNTRTIAKEKDNPKIKAVHDIIESGEGKVIVVYTYKASGEALTASLKKYYPAMLRGGMSPQEIQSQKNIFGNNIECRVMVAQQSAACMGHTLLGGEGTDRCHRMIFYENSFSLRDFLQMRDRIHRGAQDFPCDYYHLATSPMDMGVINSLTNKWEETQMVDNLIKIVREFGRE